MNYLIVFSSEVRTMWAVHDQIKDVPARIGMDASGVAMGLNKVPKMSNQDRGQFL